jgi:hypothetical protein
LVSKYYTYALRRDDVYTSSSTKHQRYAQNGILGPPTTFASTCDQAKRRRGKQPREQYKGLRRRFRNEENSKNINDETKRKRWVLMFVVVTRAEPISNVPPKLRCKREKKEKEKRACNAMQCGHHRVCRKKDSINRSMRLKAGCGRRINKKKKEQAGFL